MQPRETSQIIKKKTIFLFYPLNLLEVAVYLHNLLVNNQYLGICEPIDDPKCMNKNDWLDCPYYEEHICPDFDDPGKYEGRLSLRIRDTILTYLN